MIDLLLATFFQLAAGAPASAGAAAPASEAAAGAASSEDWFDDASDEGDADPDNVPAASAAAADVPVASPGVDVTASAQPQERCTQRPVTGSRMTSNVCMTAAEEEQRRQAALQDLEYLTRLRDVLAIEAARSGR